MHHDTFGLPTVLSDRRSVTQWNAAQLGVLSHAAVTPTHLMATLESAPEFAMGWAVKGMLYLLLGRRELVATVQEAQASAHAAVKMIAPTWREQKYVDALDVWMKGRPSQSVAILEEILTRFPEDALAMKLSHSVRFVLGDAVGMRASLERVLPAYGTDHPAHGYILGCHAFSLEETGEYTRAENAGRQALWTAPDDAWGLHAVAHVHDMTGNSAAGLKWLDGQEKAWMHCNNFRFHVWWHKALMHLDQGQVDAVFALYDEEIRKEKSDDYRDISNATSLLMRLELDGHNVGDRWEELADLSAARTEDGSLIFADLHYLLATAGGRREEATQAYLRRIARDSQQGGSDANERFANPGLQAAHGLHHFGEGEFEQAFTCLVGARDAMQLAGGSHAQRDVFERITIDAGIRAGRLDTAERILNERTARRASHDDAYASARRSLIAAGRDVVGANRVPAQ